MDFLHYKNNASNRDVISLFPERWDWISALQRRG